MINRILAVLIVALAVFVSCTKESPDVRLDPSLSTSQLLNVTSDSATVIGFVIAQGSGFTEKGVCYNTEANPTISNSKVVYTGEDNNATFSVVLSGLNFATTYYARAYATGSGGTIYGEEYNFTTLPELPVVSTAEITLITGTSATGGGEVTSNGGAEITARGVCFSADTIVPSIDDAHTSDSTGIGQFISELTNLAGSTKYYVRAYATNSVGTVYGEAFEFTTLEIIITSRTWYVPGDYVAASYPDSTFADWNPANSPFIQSLEASPDSLEGYVYMINESNLWKLTTQPDWNGTTYGDGGEGILDPEGGDISSPAGYYKLNVDAAALTYTAVATEWGVIGDATPGGWEDETPLSYDPPSMTWRGGLHLTAANFKFRANHTWDYNYGSTAENDTLDFDGGNIPVDFEADYFFVLDLSHPNAYTYTANYWGLIGSATPDGWETDQDMIWDAETQSLTITLDLVAGEIKFRANDAWDLDYGGDINALTPGGANIPIAEDGNYTIHFYLTSVPSCTIVKN